MPLRPYRLKGLGGLHPGGQWDRSEDGHQEQEIALGFQENSKET